MSLNRLWNWIKWPLGIGLLVLLYLNLRNQQGFRDFLASPKNWGYLSASLLLITFSTVLAIVRWHLLIWALDIPLRFGDALRLGFAALPLNIVCPGGLVGGDLFKAFFIARSQPGRRAEAAATVLLDRVLGLIPLVVLGAIASLFLEQLPASVVNTGVRWILLLGSIGGVLGLFIMLQPWFTRLIWVRGLAKLPYVGSIAVNILNGVTLYQSRPRVLVFAVLMGFVGHVATICGFYYGAVGAGVWCPSLSSHMYFMPLAEVIGMIPSPMPAGIGPLELAVSEAYMYAANGQIPVDVARTAGLLATLTFRVVCALVAAVGAVYYLSARKEFGAVLAEAKG